MSAAKRPASSSPSPVPEAKKHHIDDAGTITELNDDTVSADYQGDMSTSSWWDDDMAISRPTSGSPSLSPTQESQKYISDDTATIASCGDKIGSADNLKGSGTSDEQDHADGTIGPKADIEYRICLSITGEEGHANREQDHRKSIKIYLDKPWWWDTNRYYIPDWVEDVQDRYNEGPPTSPITLPAASASPDPAMVLASGQHNLVGDGIAVSPRSPSTVSTASSASRSPSATPPPVPTTAFLRLCWADGYYTYEDLFTCDLMSSRADPTNIKLRQISTTFEPEPEAIHVYFERLDHDEHVVVDDNNNRMLVGYICFDSDQDFSVTAFGKRVIDGENYGTTELSSAERERIVQSYENRLTRERLERYGSEEAEMESEEVEASGSSADS